MGKKLFAKRKDGHINTENTILSMELFFPTFLSVCNVRVQQGDPHLHMQPRMYVLYITRDTGASDPHFKVIEVWSFCHPNKDRLAGVIYEEHFYI